MPIELRQSGGGAVRYRSTGFARFDGQTLSLCRYAQADYQDTRSCGNLLGTFEDWRQGIEQRIATSDFLRGQLRCDLAPGEGMPRRVT